MITHINVNVLMKLFGGSLLIIIILSFETKLNEIKILTPHN